MHLVIPSSLKPKLYDEAKGGPSSSCTFFLEGAAFRVLAEPKPSTLDPVSLNHKAKAPNPKPGTLNPEPSTQYPKSKTLNPEAYSLLLRMMVQGFRFGSAGATFTEF